MNQRHGAPTQASPSRLRHRSVVNIQGVKDMKKAEENRNFFSTVEERLKASERTHFKKDIEEIANWLDTDFAENAIALSTSGD